MQGVVQAWVKTWRVRKAWFAAVTHTSLVQLLGIFCIAETTAGFLTIFLSQLSPLHDLTQGEICIFSLSLVSPCHLIGLPFWHYKALSEGWNCVRRHD